MNLATLNICGVGGDSKKNWAKRICYENKIIFFGLQETKTDKVESFLIQSLWWNQDFNFTFKKSQSGGIIAIWDRSSFSMHSIKEGEGFLAIFGVWHIFDTPSLMIIVYALQDNHKKKSLWKELTTLINDVNTLTIVFGDFNEVRSANERMGTSFCKLGANHFNNFISQTGLCDLPLGRQEIY